MRIAPAITLSSEQQATLEQWARSRSLPARVVDRARIVLLAAQGRQDKQIAATMKTTPKKVSRWRRRFLTLGMAGLEQDAPRQGRTPKITARVVRRVVHMTTRQKPPNATHWSTRSMARAVGISEASVRRIWRRHGLKPHRVESFKISHDPQFAEKLVDIVGLYLNPPEHAIVLCVDEKSQIQALDRMQPGLPLNRGRGQTLTHDYKRNGTATLFAALNVAKGEIDAFCRTASTPRMAQVSAAPRSAMPSQLNYTWSAITMRPTSIPRFSGGSLAIHGFTCTSLRPVPRGSTWWSASSAISRRTDCGAVYFAIWRN